MRGSTMSVTLLFFSRSSSRSYRVQPRRHWQTASSRLLAPVFKGKEYKYKFGRVDWAACSRGRCDSETFRIPQEFYGTWEAEVPLLLHTNNLGVCMLEMKIRVTLPYQCKILYRTIERASWAGIGGGKGSCRALQQRCGSVLSNAAVPYVDMYCRTPSGQVFEGMAQERKLDWISPHSDDKCWCRALLLASGHFKA